MLSLLLLGCLKGPVDSFTTQRVVPAALLDADVDRACRTGGALKNALVAVPRREPHLALVIADTTAALCDGTAARSVAVETAVFSAALEGPARIAVTRDGRIAERRLRGRAALRFSSAWDHAQAEWPWIGGECGRVRSKDELTFLIGMMAGTLAMLNDKATGSELGVPLDTLARIGRSAVCVDDATWWAAPSMFEAAAWTLVPGSAPAGVDDPWAELEERARRGSASGVRLGWALAAVLAANAGREDLVRTAIDEASQSYETVPTPPEFALLDAYAHELLQHEADLLSIGEQGHRAAGLKLPRPPVVQPSVTPATDPFAEPEPDPFAPEP